MTKECRDNFDGLTYDEDDTVEFVFMDRHDPRGLLKIEGDVSRATFLKLYGDMVKKPKYQLYVKHTAEEREETGKYGYWKKLE